MLVLPAVPQVTVCAMVLCGFNFLKYMCFKWILYVRELKVEKKSHTGSSRWRDLLWCSVICKNLFLAAYQLLWSADPIRWSRLWTLAKWFVQLSSNGICHWGATTVSLGSCEHCPAQSYLPQKGGTRGPPLLPGAVAGPIYFCLKNECHKDETQMLFSLTYCTYKVGKSEPQRPFSGAWFRCTTRMTKLTNLLPLHHLPSAGTA